MRVPHLYLTPCCLLLLTASALAAPQASETTTAAEPTSDPRAIQNGHPIPDEGYCDQPYVVVLPSGRWLCVMTTGPGKEGQLGQHVVSTTSDDHGQTWSPLVDIEPATGPEASWVVPLLTPSGRVYAFYDYNGDRIDQLDGRKIRADMLGWYVYKYSDDGGQTWSPERRRLPMRVTACDRANNWQGKVQIFWGICKPQIAGQEVLFAFSKLGRFILDDGEGWLYRSPNILQERDPSRIAWDLWPQGDHGIRGPAFGSVQEEHNLAWLGDDDWYCVYRTTQGFPCHTYSRDGGRSWAPPEPMTYSPGGSRVKHPRACIKLWRAANGRLLCWFHNHGGQDFKNRNPAWLMGGEIIDGHVHWSQPEILLYDRDPATRMSYPDLIEHEGRYWVTETQKTVARVHAIDPQLLHGLWNQRANHHIARQGLAVDLPRGAEDQQSAPVPQQANLTNQQGLTIEIWFDAPAPPAQSELLELRAGDNIGIAIAQISAGNLTAELAGKKQRLDYPADAGATRQDALQHAVLVLDAGPGLAYWIVNGVRCDGGEQRQSGWLRAAEVLDDLCAAGSLQIHAAAPVARLRIYDRPLRVSEAIGNFRAGNQP